MPWVKTAATPTSPPTGVTPIMVVNGVPIYWYGDTWITPYVCVTLTTATK